MRRARLGCAIGALAAAVVTAHGARAADPADTTATAYPECSKVRPVSPANANAAHGAFVAGKASFDAGDYATALIYLKDAYRRDCRKIELLLIIARSYELLGSNGGATGVIAPGARRSGSKREAARALEVYLQRAPADGDVETQRSHLTRLNEEIARMDAEDEAAATKRAAAVPVPASPGSAAATTTTEAPGTTSPAPAPRAHTAAPWIVAAIGGAGVVAGAVVFGVGSSKESTAKSSCNNGYSGCSPDVAAEGNHGAHDKTAGIVVLSAGGAALVGGLVWHFAEPTGAAAENDRAAFSIDPLFAPGLAGLGAHGRF